jgi:hypothetical protein
VPRQDLPRGLPRRGLADDLLSRRRRLDRCRCTIPAEEPHLAGAETRLEALAACPEDEPLELRQFLLERGVALLKLSTELLRVDAVLLQQFDALAEQSILLSKRSCLSDMYLGCHAGSYR